MKNILITGGAGYIGSHSIFPLKEEGFVPVVYDNLSMGHRLAVKSAQLVVGDLADEKKLGETFKEYNIDAVMHFAGSCYVGESVTDPQKYFINNISNTLTLIKVMLANNVNKIVFSSSCAVYGEPINIPIREDHPKEPVNPYGLSKRIVESLLEEYAKSYNLKYAILRYFNAAGASVHENIGEDHSPETHIIPLAIMAAADSDRKLTIFGGDYGTHDGTCIRDYVHVEDVISAHILALKALFENDRRLTYNIGSGTGYTVKEVISAVEAVTGKNIYYEVTDRRAGDVEKLVASSEKIYRELGWVPKIRKLAEIIDSAWKWHKNNPKGYKIKN